MSFGIFEHQPANLHKAATIRIGLSRLAEVEIIDFPAHRPLAQEIGIEDEELIGHTHIVERLVVNSHQGTELRDNRVELKAVHLLFLSGLLILKYIGPWIARNMMIFFEKMILVDMGTLDIPEKKEIIPFALDWLLWLGLLAGPFLLMLAVAAYLVHYYQVGFLITTKPLRINLNKLNPINGIKRLFSVKNLVMLAMNSAKLSVVMYVAWIAVSAEVQKVLGMVEMEVAGMFIHTTDTVLNLAIDLSILLAVLGYIDFKYQKHNHAESIKMSKQEIKDEFKQQDGDPKIKQKRRQKQMELAQQRMMQEVPQAEVVVRNPTHFAVALSFKPEMEAPVVVAKGKDKIALRIIDIAREHRVPLVENPPLARELYKKVEVGEAIPPEFFEVVAQLIASVMTQEKRLEHERRFEAGRAGAA